MKQTQKATKSLLIADGMRQEIGNLRSPVDILEMVKETVLLGMIGNVNLTMKLSLSQNVRNVFTNNPANISRIAYFTTQKVKKLKIGRTIQRKFQKFVIIINKAWSV